MAFLFNKFQEAVKVLAKSPTFAKDPRKMQFEADINRLFLYTCYNRLGRTAEEADVDEVIEMANKASVDDQQKQVQENIHSQTRNFSTAMDSILLSGPIEGDEAGGGSSKDVDAAPRRSGLSFAVGQRGPSSKHPAIPKTKPLSLAEVSLRLKESIGYALDLKPSQIPHEAAGTGLFVNGEVDVGTVIAFYPGVIYAPAYYRYISGYPRVDAKNPYLITRYDGTVINAQPWGSGGDTRELWDGSKLPENQPSSPSGDEKGSDRLWKTLSKPVEGTRISGGAGEIIERRNPLALAHFANHPAKGMAPNVMICPYDFPLTEKEMRTYVPNVSFGNADQVSMRRFGSFWWRTGSREGSSDVPIMKALVLVATRAICDEEVLLNYRLSNSKRRPTWYTPVDEEEDRRRWS
ncbi:unnamed protein product [Linum tenue]|uniref:SET domain-containing protein n=1 Tax=Linum tenue TaxID=586396 RepID=A0AAV0MB69_9ROSI|nr:unnamed protein product [Linum tenue]